MDIEERNKKVSEIMDDFLRKRTAIWDESDRKMAEIKKEYREKMNALDKEAGF